LNDSILNGRPIQIREDREDEDLKGASSSPPRQAKPRVNRQNNGPIQVARRIYVGNLAWQVSWQDLKDHFRQIGEVIYADVMKERNSDRSRGCGIVEFSTSEEAARAINELNDTEIKGRQIFVREDREDRELQ
jgi:RNA recognition motif-containing protein